MTDETYEGWKNRETWAIQLHLSNNEGDYLSMQDQARELVEENADDTDAAVAQMASYIEEWTSEVFDLVINPQPGESDPGDAARMFVGDVGSFWRADFYEIAEHWIEEAREIS